MQLSTKGAAFIRAHEGFVPRWYLDPVGVPTIGVGFTWRSGAFQKWWEHNKPSVKFAKGATMTRAEADDALQVLVAEEYGAAVNRFLGKSVPQHVFDAMCSMTFNCGPGALEWKWAQAAKASNYNLAASLLRTTATTAGGKTLKGLVRRRKEEAELLLNGNYAGISTGEPTMDSIMRRGQRGKNVQELQGYLTAHGYYDGALDGQFGPGTEAAVMAFQRAHGLTDDGIAGPRTMAALTAAAKPPAKPTTAPHVPRTTPAPAEVKRGYGPLIGAGVITAILVGIVAFVLLA